MNFVPTGRAPINLDQAVVYDIETFPNCLTINVVGLYSDLDATFEISQYRDDRNFLLQWFDFWRANNTPMIGFNNLNFDYPVIHQLFSNPQIDVADLYDHAMMLIGGLNRFNAVWESDRFAPQIDLFKIHHFDNKAKSTSLKALQVNMRSETVLDMPLQVGVPLSREQVDTILIPYNKHDVQKTKQFALISLEAIKFRIDLMATLRGDVLNFNDTKIGAKILEQRLGDEVCYDLEYWPKVPRQSPRSRIPLNDIIFSYISFKQPEFNRVLQWMRTQTLTADELTENIKTKGVFTGVHATVGELDFYFGTGGIHGSVSAQTFAACDEYALVDVDVASLYPSIAIVNGLYPEHLGQSFVDEYAKLPKERKEWQAKKGKKCVEANSLKLAGNGTYGNTNNKFSVFYDPKFTMTITINGQLMLCMLAEMLLDVPTLQIIQINTDGITYQVHPSLVAYTRRVYHHWEGITRLTLEEAQYKRMWIRDVNNYIAESMDGALKMKGAYWYPVKFPDDISSAQPPAWHKDFSAQVSIMAAVDHMVNGTDIERFVYAHQNPFDFMCRAKVDRASKLYIGDEEVQRITRYYVAHNGGHMRKVSPPVKGAQVGDYKRKNGISDSDYHAVLQEIGPGVHDERIHTKNKSKYEIREMSIESGYKVADCNVASRFDFQNVNYDYYIDKAKKLVIA
jgi:hypothetical protein